MEKIKVTAVSYLNTKPLLYGLVNDPISEEIDLHLDIPSDCAKKLQAGTVDLGLVPVAIIPHLDTPYIISDFCIGTNGTVKTVSIFSEVPIENITHLYLDFHSRTSVELAKILIEKHWELNVEYLPAKEGFIDAVSGTTACVVIGDRTIGLEKRFPHVYDLGATWKAYTGLPFVFAAWVSNRPLPAEFVARFNQALTKGIEAIPKLSYLIPSPSPDFSLEAYFTQHISYNLTKEKKKALAIFLEEISENIPSTLELI